MIDRKVIILTALYISLMIMIKVSISDIKESVTTIRKECELYVEKTNEMLDSIDEFLKPLIETLKQNQEGE